MNAEVSPITGRPIRFEGTRQAQTATILTPLSELPGLYDSNCARVQTSMGQYLDQVEKHWDRLATSVITLSLTENNQPNKDTLSILVEYPPETGLRPIEVGVAYQGTSGLMGWGKPVVTFYTMFHAPDKNGNIRAGYRGMMNTASYQYQPKGGQPFELSAFRPHQHGWVDDFKFAYAAQFKPREIRVGSGNTWQMDQGTVEQYDTGWNGPPEVTDARMMRLFLALLEKSDGQATFNKLLSGQSA